LPSPARGLVTVGRLAAAAGIVVTVGLASFVQRAAPEVHLAEAAAPVSRMVEQTRLSAGEQPRLAAETVETIRSSLASPVARLSLSREYRPEDQIRFDIGVPGPALPRPEVYAAHPAPLTLTPDLARAAMAHAAIEHRAPQAENPFLLRFEPLLVILAEPQPRIDEELAPADDR
jgi:hypothetical protein